MPGTLPLLLLLLLPCATGLYEDKVLLLQSSAAGLPILSPKDPPFAEGPFSCDTLVARKCEGLGASTAAASCGATPFTALADSYNRTLLFYTCSAALPPLRPALAAASSSSSLGGGGGAVGRRPPSQRQQQQQQQLSRGSVWEQQQQQQQQLPPDPLLGPAAPPCTDSASAPLVCLQTVPSTPPTGRAPVRVQLAKRLSSSSQAGSRCTCYLRHGTVAGGAGLSSQAPGLAPGAFTDSVPVEEFDALYGSQYFPG